MKKIYIKSKKEHQKNVAKNDFSAFLALKGN